MDYRDENWKASYLFVWMIVNALGSGIGVVLGEMIGQWAGTTFGREVGVFFASIVFEVIVWTLRQSVLKTVRVFREWAFSDKLIWFVSEMMGALLGTGFYEVTKDTWMTFGPVFGSLIGTGIIITVWFIKIPRSPSTSWARGFQAFLFGIVAMFGGSFLIGAIFVFSQEMGRFFQNFLGHFGGLGVTGGIIGISIGLIIGAAFVRMKVIEPIDLSAGPKY